MKMPEIIRVGLCTADEDNIDPRPVDRLGRHHRLAIPCDGADIGFLAEYRFVRLVEVTKTFPPPILEVKEVDQ